MSRAAVQSEHRAAASGPHRAAPHRSTLDTAGHRSGAASGPHSGPDASGPPPTLPRRSAAAHSGPQRPTINRTEHRSDEHRRAHRSSAPHSRTAGRAHRSGAASRSPAWRLPAGRRSCASPAGRLPRSRTAAASAAPHDAQPNGCARLRDGSPDERAARPPAGIARQSLPGLPRRPPGGFRRTAAARRLRLHRTRLHATHRICGLVVGQGLSLDSVVDRTVFRLSGLTGRLSPGGRGEVRPAADLAWLAVDVGRGAYGG